MKKFIFIVFISIFAAAGARAQGANFSFSTGTPAPNANAEIRAKDVTDRMNNLLNLTQDQYNQILQVNRRFFSNMASGGGGRQAARVNEGRQQQLKAILNGDQWQTYQNARQQGQSF